ncbi:unnamed protein product [Trichobilharzia regenti]|nr:unnamed protein product [Trichobilharzia regenti]
MCQAANYAMPVVTRTMSLAERTFAWPSIPGFGLKAKNGTMRDRLLEIHTDVIQLAQRLHACMELVNDKIAQDKRIEQYYLQHSSAQEEVRRNLLRSLQAQRVYTECLEGQNDRLAGLATKLNPKFVKTADFAEMTGPIITIKEPRRRDINQNSSEVVLVNSSNVDSCNTSQHDVLLMDSNCDVKINESNEFVQKLNTGRSYINADKYFKVNNSQTTPSRETINSQKRHTNTNKTSDMPKSLESIQNSGSIAVDNLLLGIDSVASGNLKRHEQLQQQKHMNKSNAVKVNESISPNETSPSKNHQVQINSHLNPLIKTPSTQFSQVECLSTQSSVDGHPVSVTSRHLGDDNNNTPRLSESRSMTRPTQNTSITLNQPVDYSSTKVDIRHQRSGNNDDEEYEFTDETFSSKGRNLRLNTSPNYSLDPSSSQENSDLSRNLNTNVNASDIHLPRILPKVKRFGRKDQHLRSSRSASTSAIKYLDHNSFESDEIQRKPGQGRLHNNRMDNNIHPCKKCHEYQLQYDRIKCNDGSQRVLNHKSHYTVNEMSQINNGVKLVPTVGTDECSKICIPEWSAKLVHKSNKAEDLLQDPKRSAINRALISHRCRLVETILQADEEKLEEIISLLLKD